MPMVASILLFVVYYMIDTLGFNLSYNGTWATWLGMWFSTFILLPIGAFLTYEASRDSVALNLDELIFRLKKFLRPERIRNIVPKELILDYVPNEEARILISTAQESMHEVAKNPFVTHRRIGFATLTQLNRAYRNTSQSLDRLVNRLVDTNNRLVLAKLMDLPQLPAIFAPLLPKKKVIYIALLGILPLSLPYVWYLLRRRKVLLEQWELCRRTLDELANIYETTNKEE